MTLRTERSGAEIKSVPLNFKEIAETALFSARSLLPRWLPGGRWEGEEYVAKNPTRADEHPGSFKSTPEAASGATLRQEIARDHRRRPHIFMKVGNLKKQPAWHARRLIPGSDQFLSG